MMRQSFRISGGPQAVLDAANVAASSLRDSGEDLGVWEVLAHNGPDAVSVWPGVGSGFTRALESCHEFVRATPSSAFVLEVAGSNEQEIRARQIVTAALA